MCWLVLGHGLCWRMGRGGSTWTTADTTASLAGILLRCPAGTSCWGFTCLSRTPSGSSNREGGSQVDVCIDSQLGPSRHLVSCR